MDTTQSDQIAAAAKQIITDSDKWRQFSKSGIINVRKHYTWQSHAATYLKAIKDTQAGFDSAQMNASVPKKAIGRRLARLEKFLVADIDGTLIGGQNDQVEALLIDQRYTEYLCQHGGNVAGVGIVAVDDIRNTLLFLNEPDGFIDIFIQVRPQRLFAHLLAPPALNAHDTARITDLLDRLGVVLGNVVIHDQACKQVHLLHILALAERAGQLDDVYDLPTGVRIPAKLHVSSPQQPMNAE